MLVQKLQDYGLNKKQASIYLKTLELGSAPASTIARFTGMNRVTVYDILKSLQTMGIVTCIKKKHTTYYSVISPDALASRLKEKLASFEKVVPELLAIAEKFSNTPKVQLFEGVEGLKQMYQGLLSSSTDILAFVGPGVAHKKLMSYLREEFLPQRIKAQVFAKVITPKANKDSQRYVSIDKKFYKETRVIDDPLFHMTNEVGLFDGDKVYIALFNDEELSGLLIQSKSLYTTLSQIFGLVRKSLPPTYNNE